MQDHFSQLPIYTEQDNQASRLVGVAVMNPEALTLSADDLDFMLACEGEPIRSPTPAMMRAIERSKNL